MIRRMTKDDIPAGMRLKESAGWNQTEQDWVNVLDVEPEGCWVYEVDGVAAGATTAVCYGTDLAWIGMVLVLPEFRRRGIARSLMQHALAFTEARGVGCVKLDATDMGRPLYLDLGFEDEAPIERWATVAESQGSVETPGKTSSGDPPPLTNVADIAPLDRQAFGADRAALLGLLADRYRQTWTLPGAYLMSRPGSNARFLGPCVAKRIEDAERLIRGLLRRYQGEPVFWDLLPDNQEACGLAQALGFEAKRRLVRMARTSGSCSKLHSEIDQGLQYATAGFEYG